MKTADFIRKHNACREGARWALSISEDMADVWDAMIEQNRHEWLLWTATRPVLFPDSAMRELACRFVRETPIGRETVWDKLTDGRSRVAVCVAEAYADGDATDAELSDAYAAARDAADAAEAVADADAYAERVAYFAAVAASNAAYSAAYAADSTRYAADAATYAAEVAAYAAADAAHTAAYAAQIKMIAELGNPFKKESSNEDR